MPLTPAEITSIRTSLGLSQLQLGQLLGVHPLTVSRWERGVLVPTPHHQALLQSFQRARVAKSDIGTTASTLIMTAGIAIALYVLLDAAFGEGAGGS